MIVQSVVEFVEKKLSEYAKEKGITIPPANNSNARLDHARNAFHTFADKSTTKSSLGRSQAETKDLRPAEIAQVLFLMKNCRFLTANNLLDKLKEYQQQSYLGSTGGSTFKTQTLEAAIKYVTEQSTNALSIQIEILTRTVTTSTTYQQLTTPSTDTNTIPELSLETGKFEGTLENKVLELFAMQAKLERLKQEFLFSLPHEEIIDETEAKCAQYQLLQDFLDSKDHEKLLNPQYLEDQLALFTWQHQALAVAAKVQTKPGTAEAQQIIHRIELEAHVQLLSRKIQQLGEKDSALKEEKSKASKFTSLVLEEQKKSQDLETEVTELKQTHVHAINKLELELRLTKEQITLVNQLGSMASESQKEFQDFKEKGTKQISQLRTQANQMEKQLEEEKQKSKELEIKLTKSETELETLRQQETKTQEKESQAFKKLESATKTLAATSLQIQPEAESKIRLLEEEVQRLEKENQGLREKLPQQQQSTEKQQPSSSAMFKPTPAPTRNNSSSGRGKGFRKN